jgi:hypothetical protein
MRNGKGLKGKHFRRYVQNLRCFFREGTRIHHYGEGQVWYAGPVCSLINDQVGGLGMVFLFNADCKTSPLVVGDWLKFSAFAQKRQIQKHRMTTWWQAATADLVI